MNTGNLFLDGLPPDIKQRLSFQLKPIKLAKHDRLYEQGQKIETVYFPISAVISKYQFADEERAIEVGLIGREGVVGLASALASLESMHTSKVCIGGNALKIRVEYILKILEKEPDLRTALMKSIYTQLRCMSRRVLCNRYHSVEQRFCTWLLLIVERSAKTNFRVTHADAARALGVHRPTITEASHLLSESGVIERSTARIKVLDKERLHKLACECVHEFSMNHAASRVPIKQSSRSAA